MDKKSKIFFAVFFTLIFIAAGVSFYKFYVLKDYYIKLEVDCDPETENCFVYECDEAIDGECPAEPKERVSYYKLIEKKAYALPLCDPSESDCPAISCELGEDCREILCDEAAEEEGELCSNPQEYLIRQMKNKDGDENASAEAGEENGLNGDSNENKDQVLEDAEIGN